MQNKILIVSFLSALLIKGLIAVSLPEGEGPKASMTTVNTQATVEMTHSRFRRTAPLPLIGSGESEMPSQTSTSLVVEVSATDADPATTTNDDNCDDCSIPADIRDRFMEVYNNHDPMFPPFFAFHDPLNKSYKKDELLGDNVTRNLDLEKDASKCVPSIRDIPSTSVHPEIRALCPWYYELEYEPSRYPPVIGHARCHCLECAGFNSDQVGCEEIVTALLVFRRTSNMCVNGFYEYHKEIQNVSVACTCARKKS